jgi:hypothetical protein
MPFTLSRFPGGEADIDTLDDYERLRAEHQHA